MPPPDSEDHSGLPLCSGPAMNSVLYPDPMRVMCVLPRTPLLRNTHLIKQYHPMIFSILLTLVLMKHKMMVTSHKIGFMSRWSRLLFENALPTAQPVWTGARCLFRLWERGTFVKAALEGKSKGGTCSWREYRTNSSLARTVAASELSSVRL